MLINGTGRPRRKRLSWESKCEIVAKVVERGLAPDEARFANRDLELEKSGLGYQRLRPNARVPFGHKHAGQEEIYVVLAGRGRIALGDDVVELKPFDAVRIPPGMMHCMEAGPDGVDYLAYGAPPIGPEDSELVAGWWPE